MGNSLDPERLASTGKICLNRCMKSSSQSRWGGHQALVLQSSGSLRPEENPWHLWSCWKCQASRILTPISIFSQPDIQCCPWQTVGYSLSQAHCRPFVSLTDNRAWRISSTSWESSLPLPLCSCQQVLSFNSSAIGTNSLPRILINIGYLWGI